MAYDLLLKGGRVVDGTGMPSFIGDVAINQGRIVAMGRVDEAATRTIDCEGLVVAPGFIDIHTHYDAQVFWDPLLTSACWHGITTVVMSNCGFALAPCKPNDRDYLMRTLTNVEGMRLEALEKGLPWTWETFGEYLDALEGRIGLNVAALVGHSALRRYVMGESAIARAATDDELTEIAGVFRSALAEGAFGFSTSLSPGHYGFYGEPVPSQMADRQELFTLAAVLNDVGVGSIEIITKAALSGYSQEDRELLHELSRVSSRPVDWNEFSYSANYPDGWREMRDFMEEACQQGTQVYGVARCNPADLAINLGYTQILFHDLPHWGPIIHSSAEERMKAYSTAALRPGLRQDMDATPASRARFEAIRVEKTALPANERFEGKAISEIAAEQRKHPVDALLDLGVEEQLETQFELKGAMNEEVVESIIKSPHSVVGISDGGAHNDMIIGSEYTTRFLEHWIRERNVMSLEEAVRQLTFVPAYVAGLRDRGVLRPGSPADVTIFNASTVRPLAKHWAADLPGGGRRLVQNAEGIEAVVVNGQVLIEGGKPTGDLPGQVLRSNRSMEF